METLRRARMGYARPVTAGVAWRRLLVGAVLGLALWARLREPLSSPVIGAEDPYLHMARTWDLIQGHGLPPGYPPGFSFLLAPFALMGPTMFYAVARFVPPFLGVVSVFGVYMLCRENLRTPAALVAATLVAIMPEHVFRTDLLFPTALDLAVLPFFLMHLVRASRGGVAARRALWWCGGIALALGIVHPWVLVFMLPPTITVALLALRKTRDRKLALVALGALVLVGLVFAFLPGAWNPAPAFLKNAGPRALELLTNPASLFPLPLHVDLPAMLTWSALALGAVGAVAALVRRTTLGVAALVYTVAILPFVFVDWFDVWFIPHRSVAYLSIGVAVLAALPVELMGALPEWNMGDVAAAAVILCYLGAVVAPVGLSVEPWYRLYEEEDQHAWKAVAARDPSLVITGSWQGNAGYRAVTGEPSLYNPQFFRDAEARADTLERHPDLVVIIDDHARGEGIKAPSGWREIGRWGGSVAYRPA